MSNELKLKFEEMQITEGKKQIKFVFNVKGNLDNNTLLSILYKKAEKELKQINQRQFKY